MGEREDRYRSGRNKRSDSPGGECQVIMHGEGCVDWLHSAHVRTQCTADCRNIRSVWRQWTSQRYHLGSSSSSSRPSRSCCYTAAVLCRLLSLSRRAGRRREQCVVTGVYKTRDGSVGAVLISKPRSDNFRFLRFNGTGFHADAAAAADDDDDDDLRQFNVHSKLAQASLQST